MPDCCVLGMQREILICGGIRRQMLEQDVRNLQINGQRHFSNY
jgi:hypothetical protein